MPRLPLVCAAALAFVFLAACGEEEPVVFTHGVASGDVRPEAAVLWTRTDRAATLTVQVATDESFTDVVVEVEVKAEEEADFTAKVEAGGLQPGETYYYRFRRSDSVSDTGTFRTAPPADEATAVRFVFSGDSDGTVRADGTRAFDFRVLDAALAEAPDFFLYIGDTIYADSAEGPKAETLDAFRAKYKENRDIERLRRLLSYTSTYAIWDDHEVENDFAGTSVDPTLLAAGRQAFREYLPIAGDDRPEVLYRRFRWGKAVDLIILDARSFRDYDVAQACTPAGATEPDILPALGAPGLPDAYRDLRRGVGLTPETDPACLAALSDPDRTMLGDAQKQFLLDALERSDATFKFVVTPAPIMEIVAQPYDRWEGYRAERDEILDFVSAHDIRNVVFLSTDLHASMISTVRLTAVHGGILRESAFLPVEAITGPIAHETLGDDIAETRGPEALPVFEGLLKQIAKVECVELDAFSYGVVEVDPQAGNATITLKDENGTELCEKVIEAR